MSLLPARAVVLTALGLFSAAGAVDARDADPATPWMKLWNGKDLDGWNYLPEVFKVDGGMIVARGRFNSSTTFCATRQAFSDFELTIRARLWEKGLTYYTNTGIQYRSKMADDARKVMHGYQLDIGDNVSASMYPEGGYPEGQKPVGSSSACKAAMRTDEFNHFVITADGSKVTHRLNGNTCLEFTATAASGIIGLQTYLPYGPGSTATTVMEADFKDIYIRPLNNSFEIPDSLAVYLNPDYSEGGPSGIASGRSAPGTTPAGLLSKSPGMRTLARGSRFTLEDGPEEGRMGGAGRRGASLKVFDPLGHALPAREMAGGAVGTRSWELPGAAGGMKVIRIVPEK